ncbi:hypothetical protein [Vibrio anguillarum]|uniref:Uncharacterized protein n=1 Tax=Vibrio anguillarum TaxID=55601 RepID=A0AAW4BH50_VIBAN|nr:hypothetical protein [Vibrio anguillarum]MBF4374443.1 hypothetical protein [Vibrio anguillarum]MBF4436965.1 hypothetical protein [Vibrio anguillarum]
MQDWELEFASPEVMYEELQRLRGNSEHQAQDGSITLEQAVSEAHYRVEAFRNFWLAKHKEEPQHFPLVLAADNSGLWHEQITDFDA